MKMKNQEENMRRRRRTTRRHSYVTHVTNKVTGEWEEEHEEKGETQKEQNRRGA